MFRRSQALVLTTSVSVCALQGSKKLIWSTGLCAESSDGRTVPAQALHGQAAAIALAGACMPRSRCRAREGVDRRLW